MADPNTNGDAAPPKEDTAKKPEAENKIPDADREALEQGMMPPGIATLVVCIFSVVGVLVLVICLIIIGVLSHAKQVSQPCGIPIWDWLMLYFTIAPLAILLLLPVICCLKCQNILCVVGAYMWILWFLLIYVAFVIILGYVLYFKDDNTCQDNYDTSVAMVFMCIFLIFGLGQLLAAVIGFFAIPIAYCILMPMARDYFDQMINGLQQMPGAQAAAGDDPKDDGKNKKDDDAGDKDKENDTAKDKQDGEPAAGGAGDNNEGGEEENLIKQKQASSVKKRK